MEDIIACFFSKTLTSQNSMESNSGVYLDASMAAQVKVKFSWMADLRIYNRTFRCTSAILH